MEVTTTAGVTPSHGVRGVLAVASFRRLWVAFTLSGLGGWLSILTLTAVGAVLTADAGYTAQSFAVGGVLILTMLPPLVLGPVARSLANRIDRRFIVVAADAVRCGLLLSVPLVGELRWVFIATFLSGSMATLLVPVRDTMGPSLVAPEQRAPAHQLGRLAAYGAAPAAAGLFALVAGISDGLTGSVAYFSANPVALALYLNAVIFLAAAALAALAVTSRTVSWRAGRGEYDIAPPSIVGAIMAGWGHIGRTRAMRGAMLGLLGAFIAGGTLIGVARVYVHARGGGDVAYGLLLGALFLGVAVGVSAGGRTLTEFSRCRMFGLSVVAAGLALALIAVTPDLVVAVLLAFVLGSFVGVAWATAYILVGFEVDDGLRGHAFGFLRSLVELALLAVLAVTPFAAGALGSYVVGFGSGGLPRVDGAHIVVLLAAVLTCVVGATAYHRMDDRRGVSLWTDLSASVRGVPYRPLRERASGLFVAFEGGEGAGKTTQVRALSVWLRDQGFDVVTTHEPGATRVGMRLRAILLDLSHDGLSPRAEALMYAADRAEHVDSVIRPALHRGAVVVTDRYVDSTLAYQGAGRRLSTTELNRLNRYSTGGLTPDLTVLLDLPAEDGLSRFGSPADRMESESAAFHERVRGAFRALADQDPDRYLVIDAARPVDEVAQLVQERLRPLLPDPVPREAEAHTGSMPAIRGVRGEGA